MLLAICQFVLIPPVVRAEEVQPPSPADVLTLAPVIVIGTLDPSPAQNASLDQEVIRHLPAGNGSSNEILRLLPGIQLSEEYNSAATGGEILPPAISISGGKIYQNNFLVDGIANNNIIDPASKWGDDIVSDAPGHPQERFLNSALIESVTLYDSNVPARFGRFAGGVVDVTTRNPGSEVEGQLSWRTTRDQWTSFHISGADQDRFASGGHENLQPKFSKNEYGATLSLPLNNKSGILGAWQQLDSRIPLPYFLNSKTQQRQQQSYFIKYVGQISADDHLELIANSTPYREERFLNNVLGSDYEVKMAGMVLQGEWKHLMAHGEVELQAAYRSSRNLRSASQHLRNWAATDSKDWGRQVESDFSIEGGFGTVEKSQESFDLKGLLLLDPITTGAIHHELTGGFELGRTLGSFDRKNPTYVYSGARLSPDIMCGSNDFDCVEREQFFTMRTLYPAGKSQAAMHQVALHGEDLFRYHQLELRPGLRFDYDDLMEQTNLAPRFVASYDLSGRGATIVSAGANRYYGSTLLTYKLREAKIPFRSESRTSYNNQPTDWTAASILGQTVTRFNTLRTPYADELSVSLDQQFAGGVLNLKYLHREGRDEFARTYSPLQANGLRYYTLNNLGRSHHERYSCTWERSWERYFLSLNASWQATTTTNESYDTSLESEGLSGRIWFNDELIFKSDLPARNQNRPLIVNLISVAELPAHVTFTNLCRYRSGYREIVQTGEFRPLPDLLKRVDPETGEEILDAVAVYEEIAHPGKVIVDWKIDWSPSLYKQQRLTFSLDINNVFNSRIQTGGSTTTYEMGRQFWAGVEYDF